MENELYKVRGFMANVVAAGVAKALQQIEPQSDRLTQRQLYAFLRKHDKAHGCTTLEHGEGWVKAKVADGSLTPKRKGKAVNSPVVYSKAEVMLALATEEAVRSNIFKDTNL